MLRRLATFAALALMGSSGAQSEVKAFPSLSRRSAETMDRSVPAPARVEPAPADAALVAEVGRLTDQATSGEQAFRAELPRGRDSVSAASGAAVSSEAWVAAQVAVSALDAARYDSVAALAGLDTLAVEKRDNEDAARVLADTAAIDPARAQVLAMVDAQNDQLDALKSGLSQP